MQYPITYTDKIVAYIDVLGFARLVDLSEGKKSEEEKELRRKRIGNYFNVVLKQVQSTEGNNGKGYFSSEGEGYSIISDSLVFWVNANIASFVTLVQKLSSIQAQLLKHEILFRGGISEGGLHIDRQNNILVGTGLIRAYELEKQALYPRVIIDRRLVPKYANETGISGFMDLFKGFISNKGNLKYSKNFCFVNYFVHVATQNRFLKDSAIQSIVDTIKKGVYDNKHVAKYDWVKDRLIEELETSLIKFDRSRDSTKPRLEKCNSFLEKLRKI